MSALAPYWKLIQYVLLAVGGAFAAAIRDGHITGYELLNIGILAAGAVAVYFKANSPTQPHAKLVVAIFTAGVTVLAAAWTDGAVTFDEWVQVVMALIAAASVGTVANVPPGPQPEAPTAPAGDTDYPYSAGAVD